jgi:23S rRNA pseudouridine2605 synthase
MSPDTANDPDGLETDAGSSGGAEDDYIERNGERLQKLLARAGLGSRRHCEELIEQGRVRVNGQVARLGARAEPESDTVDVDGVGIGVAPSLRYYLLHKPTGVVSTADDPQGRPTVVSLVPSDQRVFPVGRLDLDTEGLLLLTNDGPLTHQLTHPSHGVEKEYMVWVEGSPARGTLRILRQGVELDDGVTAPARVALVAPDLLRLVIHEGRNRQVRRMCEAVGHPVRRLVRIRIGPLSDRKLKPGQWRELTVAEVRELEQVAAVGPAAAGGRGSGAGRPMNRSQRRAAMRADPDAGDR